MTKFLEERTSIATLRPRPERCKGCIGNPSTKGWNPLFSGGFIEPHGDVDSDLWVVGISGGDEEEQMGEPLVGPSGRRLTHLISYIESSLGKKVSIYKTNVYNCRSIKLGKQGSIVNRTPPSVKELRDCASRWLFPELQRTKAKCIYLLGTDVWKFVMNERFGSFTKAMGHRLGIDQRKISSSGLSAEVVSYGKVYLSGG
jgi:uracil-DNA glycosylase family 4